MRAVRSFFRFWYDFIIGDDATIAIGVLVALAATAVLSRTAIPAWWLLPVVVVLLLAASLIRAVKTRR